MTDELKREIKRFLMYLDLSLLAEHDYLTGDGYVALQNLREEYPAFENVREEVKRLFDEIDKL